MSDADTERMTPYKLFALLVARRDQMGIQEMPIAAFAAMYYNMNRDPGDPKKGRPAAEAKTPEDFRVFKKRKRSAADPKGKRNYTLHGAEADAGAWAAWAGKTEHRKIVIARK